MAIPSNDHFIRSFLSVEKELQLPVVKIENLSLGTIERGDWSYFSCPIFKFKCSIYPSTNFLVIYEVLDKKDLGKDFHRCYRVVNTVFLATLESGIKEWVTTHRFFLEEDLINSRIFTRSYGSHFRLTQVALDKLTKLVLTGKTSDNENLYTLGTILMR